MSVQFDEILPDLQKFPSLLLYPISPFLEATASWTFVALFPSVSL